jgi:hypothetical protein
MLLKSNELYRLFFGRFCHPKFLGFLKKFPTGITGGFSYLAVVLHPAINRKANAVKTSIVF